jgi:hypothetical protein
VSQPSVVDYDLFNHHLLARLAEVEGQVKALTAIVISTNAADGRYVRRMISNANVSNPPTDSELDVAFGNAAGLGDGFMGLVNDGGAGSTVWLCFVVDGSWWYEALTEAT